MEATAQVERGDAMVRYWGKTGKLMLGVSFLSLTRSGSGASNICVTKMRSIAKDILH